MQFTSTFTVVEIDSDNEKHSVTYKTRLSVDIPVSEQVERIKRAALAWLVYHEAGLPHAWNFGDLLDNWGKFDGPSLGHFLQVEGIEDLDTASTGETVDYDDTTISPRDVAALLA